MLFDLAYLFATLPMLRHLPKLAPSRALCATTALVAASLLGACGGGGSEGRESNERGEGNEHGQTATATATPGAPAPSAASIAQGKTVYTQNCASCHGASLGAARNSANIMNAIATNKGGMGFLRGVISTADADDIAAYMSFGL
jgi:Cytochrome C oxidase, cbb3-type, subunit III